MKNIYIYAPLPAISKRVRLYKLVRFLRTQYPDLSVTHLGWSRKENDFEETFFDFSINKELLLNGGGYGGTRNKLYYLRWVWRVFWRTLKIPSKDVVWCLGLESALPVYLSTFFVKRQFYFDDPDRLLLLMNFPGWVNKILGKLERHTSQSAKAHVIPGKERYDYPSDKFVVVKNYPSQSEVMQAQNLAVSIPVFNYDLVINVNGWLSANRGIDVLFQVAQALQDDKRILFLCYGKVDGSIAEQFIQLENVQFLGHLSNAESIAYMFLSDIAFTFYKPISVINRYAESNKWGDALRANCVILVNEEVETAGYLLKEKVAISCPYLDADALKNIVLDFANNKEALHTFKKNVAEYVKRMPTFEEQIHDLIVESNEKN